MSRFIELFTDEFLSYYDRSELPARVILLVLLFVLLLSINW